MNMIRKYLYRLLPMLCLIGIWTSCADENETGLLPSSRPEGVPVGFTVQYAADEFPTRATEGKTTFKSGDVIHIAAQFYIGDISQGDGGTKQGTVQYCAYQYQNGDWISIMDNHEITWPYACDYGVFTAYYISHANGAISTEDGATGTWLLSDIGDGGTSDDTVPLKSVPVAFRFGHTVNLTFTHLCARLSVTQLDVSTVSEYWLSKPGVDTGFHNAYRLKRNSSTGLEIEWLSSPTEGYEGYGIYISRSLDETLPEGASGNTVTFYLEPDASYTGCKLNYRYNRSYITLNSDKLGELKSNHSYLLNITKDMGIVYDDPDDGGWSNPDDSIKAYKLKNIPDFLRAAGEGKEYAEDDVQILERTGAGVILLRDLDFGWRDPLSEKEFPGNYLKSLCNLITTATFDGDLHYIYNSVRPIFGDIQGRLYNLGVSNTVREGNVHKGMSGYGGLSRSVSTSGSISNVRISNLSLTLVVPSASGDTYSIGCVTGINNGKISDIGVRGKIDIIVRNADDVDVIESEIFVGGIIGQNLGVLSGCSAFATGEEDTTHTQICVNNLCNNKIAMSTGGIVGYSTNHIEDVTLNVKVDASQSTATVNCTGGMAGRLRRSTGSSEQKDFRNVSVEGNVKGGQGRFIEQLGTGKSFTGGIAGRLYNFFIDNCNSLCDVEGWQGEILSNVRYATGGAFGCIATSDVEQLVFNTTWWGNKLSGCPTDESAGCYLGTFSGIIPEHRSDDGYRSNGNSAKEQPNINFSGGQLTDESVSNGK